jgi:hypothetical protein
MKASLTEHRESRLNCALQPFFVTGLPRSRTAWLANLLTTDTTICFHDVPFSIGAVDNGKVVGFSGPQVCKQFTEVCRFFPNAPWLIVLRNPDDALASLIYVKRKVEANVVPMPDGFWDARRELISALCLKHQVQTVTFEELDDEEVMRSVWAHLLPGIPFDSQRFDLLCKMNVQQKLPYDLTAPAIR